MSIEKTFDPSPIAMINGWDFLSTDHRKLDACIFNFSYKIMDALLLKGEQDSDPLFDYIKAARAAGDKAMKDYALGKPEHLAIMLGNCIRRQNQLTTHQTDAYALKSFEFSSHNCGRIVSLRRIVLTCLKNNSCKSTGFTR